MQKNIYTFYFFVFLCISSPWISAQYTEVSIESGIAFQYDSALLIGGGGAFFDYDNDGWQDIYLAGGGGDDALYRNNGDGTFTDVSDEAGLESVADFHTVGAVTGDIDNDGFRDIFVTTWDTQRNLLLHNNGDGTFEEMGEELGFTDISFSVGASFGDFNLDGYLDLYLGNYIEKNGGYTEEEGFLHEGYVNLFYINNGDGTFEEKGAFHNLNDDGCALSVAFTDYDNDADVDIYLANDFGESIEPNALFKNAYPSNFFTNVSSLLGMDIRLYAMGIAVGDYNEDGWFDYYVTNIGQNRLLESRGEFQPFLERAVQAGVDNTITGKIDEELGEFLYATSWGTAFFDYDNDTYLDLFVSNGHIPAADFIKNDIADPNKLYRNNQANGTFTDVLKAMGVYDTVICRGMAVADYDNDGDLDILVMSIYNNDIIETEQSHTLLYRNDSPPANWLKVELEGVTNNKHGMGSRVRVSVDGRTFMREIDGGSSHASHNSTIAHFGLGDYEMVDELKVTWLGGEEQVFTNIAANQTIYIREGQETAIEERTKILLQLNSSPNPFEESTQIEYQLPKNSTVELAIYDVSGRLVHQFDKQEQRTGKHVMDWNPNSDLPSGVYFCRLTTDFGVASHRLLVSPR